MLRSEAGVLSGALFAVGMWGRQLPQGSILNPGCMLNLRSGPMLPLYRTQLDSVILLRRGGFAFFFLQRGTVKLS